MKKVKVFSIILSALMAFSLVGCNIAVATPQTESQPAPAAVETPAPAEIAEPTPEPTKEPTPEPTKEPEIEEAPIEETEAETSTEETPVEEFNPMNGLLGSNMGRYVSDDGVFNLKQFCDDDTNTAGWAVTEDGTFALIYKDGWFIESGEENNTGFVAIGDWDFNTTGRANFYTYSYTFPEADEVTVSDGDITITVPVECVIHLQDIISFTSGNGPKVAPDALGTNFKPCDPEHATTQH